MGRSQSKTFEHVERALGKHTQIYRSGVFGWCRIFKNRGKKSVKTKVNGGPWMDEGRQISNVCIPVLSVSKKGVLLNKNNHM